MANIYVASSWRNTYQKETVELLENMGHNVYDFKSNIAHMCGGPVPTSFSWAELDKNWQEWTIHEYRKNLLNSQRAAQGYLGDLRGMEWADTCVLVMPCGRSAHIEAGYMRGTGKKLIIYYPREAITQFEPDLMYLLAGNICIGADELVEILQ
jgi:hypothetical protein